MSIRQKKRNARKRRIAGISAPRFEIDPDIPLDLKIIEERAAASLVAAANLETEQRRVAEATEKAQREEVEAHQALENLKADQARRRDAEEAAAKAKADLEKALANEKLSQVEG